MPEQSPCDRFMARVRTHIAGFSGDAERWTFLTLQHEHWEALYSAFIADVDRGKDTGTTATAFDFVAIIGALQIEQAKYKQKEIAA